MPRVRTLNELSKLQECGFGTPWPRHGLKLLYWFVDKYLEFDDDNEMCWRYNPTKRNFGFHPFENRCDGNVQLLPNIVLPYYEVGNLSKPKAHMLPKYVRKDYTGQHDDSNTDRIIVSIDGAHFDRVYVTEHLGESDYNQHGTYRISKSLIKIIQRYTRSEFLSAMGI
ncbi:uncharacterized protein LOC108263016 [Ictalurus punctatus]|uniref:Uncharacterized protein LOC108263016 n=1 Tax=Ictalurus punctatus TaxID=7998 RepID=A0A2D0QMD8_ICTPU|nr:uncharacterized protein LOC108263016 [Ictalurus punctatus]